MKLTTVKSASTDMLERALAYQKNLEKNLKAKKVRKIVRRSLISIMIPAIISLVISMFITFGVNGSQNPNSAFFLKTTAYCFCKCFFLSLPAMMWFIYRK